VRPRSNARTDFMGGSRADHTEPSAGFGRRAAGFGLRALKARRFATRVLRGAQSRRTAYPVRNASARRRDSRAAPGTVQGRHQSARSPPPSKYHSPMLTRRFGRLGWQVSEVGYGLWGMGGWSGSDDQQSEAALDYAIELGCSFFDTALAYGDGH